MADFNGGKSPAQSCAYFLLGLSRSEPRFSDTFVWLNPTDSALKEKEDYQDRGFAVASAWKKEGYVLFLDDERMPFQARPSVMTSCVITRSNQDAKSVVTKLGCPKTLHLDYVLRDPEYSTEFVTWLIDEYIGEDHSKIHPDFRFEIHTASIEGRAILTKQMYRLVEKMDKV